MKGLSGGEPKQCHTWCNTLSKNKKGMHLAYLFLLVQMKLKTVFSLQWLNGG
ncbi:hypothetical protein VCE7224_03430 [Vibrio celticus]|uniref:Uncharacterized protein n=1 Tax=Vibrio celticus TaxID=446372 RepID=A0A1C3JHW1_9VIBR|nr:hypothetical protein VCE7224_03430 [Vibrio celticus]